jgi:CRISPR type III-A-associated RAMP protein Csm4
MQLDLWYINGTSFHLGRHGLEQEESGERLGSDSLFAAIVARLVALHGKDKAQQFVKPLRDESPLCVFSSAFPRAGEVCLFPTPLEMPKPLKPGAPKHKDLKKCRYVSRTIFDALIAGDELANWFTPENKLQGGVVLLAPNDKKQLPPRARTDEKIWTIEKRPRVTIGRAVPNSQIYFTGRTVFQEKCGLWFAVRWFKRDSKIEQLLNDALADLGDAGIGGERNAGFGQCKIELQKNTLDLPDAKDKHWVSLSRYLPHSDEVNALTNGVAYTIQTIPGWAQSPGNKPERRRAVRMIAEGAVLGQVARDVPGQIVDVQPKYATDANPDKITAPLGHDVWRNGRALAVGVKEKR